MAEFYEQLKKAMQIRNISQGELCKRTGIPKSAMSQYMSGKFKPKQTRTFLIAEALRVNESWLMGFEQEPMEKAIEPSNTLTVLPSDKIFMRPLYNSVAAGFGAPAENTIVSYIPTFINNSLEKDKYIWVNVEGDSMSPLIDEGSKILIRMQESIDSGQIAVVLIDNEEAVVKKVEYGNDYVTLISVNPYYPPRKFEGREVLRVRVVGVVKEVSKELQ